MRIEFTKHAREAIEERGISQELVEQTILDPDVTLPGRENKTICLKSLGNNYLKVVIVQEFERIIVITLHWVENKRVKRYN